MNMTILSPSAEAVKPRRHPRISRAEIPAPEIDPALKALAAISPEVTARGAAFISPR